MNSPEVDLPEVAPFRFSIRGLMILIAWIAVIGGWFTDRYLLEAKIQELEAKNQSAEVLQDPLERRLMTQKLIGQSLVDLPEVGVLADWTLAEDSEYFSGALRLFADKDGTPDGAGCCIYIFEFASHQGLGEGDCGEFYLLSRKGVIVKIAHGECLNS